MSSIVKEFPRALKGPKRGFHPFLEVNPPTAFTSLLRFLKDVIKQTEKTRVKLFVELMKLLYKLVVFKDVDVEFCCDVYLYKSKLVKWLALFVY